MTNVTLERTAPTQNAPATYMPQAQGQAADRRIKELSLIHISEPTRP